MRRMTILLLAVLSATFFHGCRTNRTVTLTAEDIRTITTRTFGANYAQVYKATLATLNQGDYLITNTDYRAGIIAGEKTETETADVLSSLIANAEATQYQYKANILLDSLAPRQTKVQMTIFIYETTHYEDRSPSATSGRKTLNRSLYNSLFTKISEEIRHIPDSAPPTE